MITVSSTGKETSMSTMAEVDVTFPMTGPTLIRTSLIKKN